MPATTEIFWNCQSANIFDVTLEKNYTLRAPVGVPFDGQRVTLRTTQDGNGGHTLNLHSVFYSSTTDPALTTLPGARNVLEFMYDGLMNRWGLLYVSQWGLT